MSVVSVCRTVEHKTVSENKDTFKHTFVYLGGELSLAPWNSVLVDTGIPRSEILYDPSATVTLPDSGTTPVFRLATRKELFGSDNIKVTISNPSPDRCVLRADQLILILIKSVQEANEQL